MAKSSRIRSVEHWQELIPKVLSSLQYEGDATAYGMAKRLGCSPNTARKALKSLTGKMMVDVRELPHRPNAIKVEYKIAYWVSVSMKGMRGY